MAETPTDLNTKAEFDQFIKDAGDNYVLIDFHATWCGPCKMISPWISEVAKIEGIVVGKVDVDDNSETAEACAIRAMPTFHVYHKGEKVGEVVGANQEKIQALIPLLANK